MNSLTKALLNTAIAASTLFPALSNAQEVQVPFTYRAVELTSVAGTQAVMQRIRRVSDRACHQLAMDEQLGQRRECINDLAQQLVGKIGNPGLTAMLSGRPSNVQVASR